MSFRNLTGAAEPTTGAAPTGVGEFDGREGVVDIISERDPVLLGAGLGSRLLAPVLVGGVGIESSGCSFLE